jgi:hypothetical protein
MPCCGARASYNSLIINSFLKPSRKITVDKTIASGQDVRGKGPWPTGNGIKHNKNLNDGWRIGHGLQDPLQGACSHVDARPS